MVLPRAVCSFGWKIRIDEFLDMIDISGVLKRKGGTNVRVLMVIVVAVILCSIAGCGTPVKEKRPPDKTPLGGQMK